MARIRDLRRGNWYWTENALLDVYGSTIKMRGVAVYAVLCRHANGDGESWPGVRRIAKMLGCSKPTVLKALRELRDVGLIHTERIKTKAGDYDSNLYTLLPIGVVKNFDHVVKNFDQGGKESGTEQYPLNKDMLNLWKRVLGELQEQMTRSTFDRWLNGSRLLEQSNGKAVIEVLDAYAVEWCDVKLRPIIERTLSGITGHAVQIEFRCQLKLPLDV